MKLNFLLCFIILIAALYVSETREGFYEFTEDFRNYFILMFFVVICIAPLMKTLKEWLKNRSLSTG